MLHFAMFCSNYPPHTGGLEVMAQNVAHGLARRHRVTVITSAYGDAIGRSEEGGVTVYRLPAIHRTEAHGVPYPVPTGPGVREALRAVADADRVHAHGALYVSTMLASRHARKLGCPLVLTEHVGFVDYRSRSLNSIQRTAWSTIGDRTVRSAAAVVVYNRRVQAWITSRYPRQTIRYIGNGVDFSRFRPRSPEEVRELRRVLGLPPDRRLVLFAGRDAAKKNFEWLLDLPRENYSLVVCGAQRSVDSPSVIDLGAVPYARMPDIFAAVDLMVLPSMGEGLPLASQEALATGLPLAMLWDEGYEGWLSRDAVAACSSLEEVKAALDRLLADDPSRARLGEAGRSWALSTWSWESTVAQYEALFAELNGVRADPGQE